ncbi:MAG: PQQ-dependent sugar dehydrogenase, partial [Phycisphaeraceae bacterium]
MKGSRYTLEIEPFAEHAGQNAIDLTHAGDGSGRVFVSTQSGQVYAFGPDGRSLGVFLDIASVRDDFVRSDGAFQGLMYVAFHPDYAEPDARGTGRFYTGHQVRVDDTTPAYDSKDHGARGDSNVRFVVAEWRVDADNPDRIDPASYRRVLLINFHTTGSNPHAMGELAFNPFAEPGDADYGNLYIAIGDSNNRNDSGDTDLRYAQRVDNPFAKMLRIDPLADGDRPYTIPDDNPFDNEVFALGLRNAQSYSFAKDLDDEPVLIAFDMGAALVEEINLVRLGSNYGWDRFEGTRDYDAARELHSPARPPAAQYAHTFPTRVGEDPTGGPAAIIGGLVVSDPDEPLMRGQVLFADLPRGTFMHASLHEMLDNENAGRQAPIYIMQARWGEKRGTFADLVGADRGDVRFGVGEDATVYLVSKQTQT